MTRPDPISPDPRFTLALERTLLAWIRTTLALMGLGFIVARMPLVVRDANLAGPPLSAGASQSIGVGLVCLAVVVQIIALFDYHANGSRVKRGETVLPSLWSGAGILGMVLAAVGFVLAGYLIVVG